MILLRNSGGSLELTTVIDDELSLGATSSGTIRFDSLDDIQTTKESRYEYLETYTTQKKKKARKSENLPFSDLTKDDVLTIQPGSLDGGDEELRTVGVLI